MAGRGAIRPQSRPGRAASDGTYDVRIYGVRSKQRKRGPVYEVRWQVEGRTRGRTFTTKALADGFRSGLLVAARNGEPFDVETGEPASRRRFAAQPTTWWSWMLEYVDLKWPSLAPSSRRSLAEGLLAVTQAMLPASAAGPSVEDVATVVRGWACNSLRRAQGTPPPEWVDTIDWLEAHSVTVSALDDPALTRAVLDSLAKRRDGTIAAATTIARKRAVFFNAMEHAVECQLLTSNPLDRVRWRAPRPKTALDPRDVVSPALAAALLQAVAAQGRTGQHLVAFFGCMYYAALRPSEALALRVDDLVLPASDAQWGELLVSRNNPQVSGSWTDEGRRAPRQLKHRARGDVRRVPVAPQLVALLRAHLAGLGAAHGEQLFRGAHLAHVQQATYTTIWRRARLTVLSEEQRASGLVRRPYDLRHSAVSTWLAAGVDSVRVAEWAGHSVEVLHRVYAHVLPGGHEFALQLIARQLDVKHR